MELLAPRRELKLLAIGKETFLCLRIRSEAILKFVRGKKKLEFLVQQQYPRTIDKPH